MAHLYQLVIQFSADTIADFDELIELETAAMAAIDSQDLVDGHDFGSGEANIFIHCGDPRRVFLLLKERVLSPTQLSRVKVAYRAMGEDEFVMLHPPGLKEFRVT